MDKKMEPSEHVRLEIEMLSDKSGILELEAHGVGMSGSGTDILVVTGDENMRLYIEGCLRPVAGFRVLAANDTKQPDLLVIDGVSGDEGREMHPGVPRVLILEERPGVEERRQIAESRVPVGIVVTPFDARGLARAALDVLRRR